jgi:hypothetical protein
MAAEWLNDTVGGGNEGRKGQIFGISTDVSPEMMKMWTEAVGKNLLRDVSNIIDVVNAVRKGEMPDVQNTPYARDYVRPVSNDTRFYEQTDERDKLETEFDRLVKAGKYDQAFEVVQKHPLAADEPAKGLRKMQSTIKEVRDLERHATKKGEKEEYRTIRRRLQAQYLEVVLGEKPLE